IRLLDNSQPCHQKLLMRLVRTAWLSLDLLAMMDLVTKIVFCLYKQSKSDLNAKQNQSFTYRLSM
ncbi:hypothetical protein ACKI1L_37730, partial [Streptomyces scabiei]|uniref:hypothetical protein n=1 Tax=Streptomyces scabiei TaxID=1930 RepID=UPI0038F782C5